MTQENYEILFGEWIAKNGKINAIKLMRDLTAYDLVTCKDTVDRLCRAYGRSVFKTDIETFVLRCKRLGYTLAETQQLIENLY